MRPSPRAGRRGERMDAQIPQPIHSPPPSDNSDGTTVNVAGHTLTLFTEAPRLFTAMLDDIHSARHCIWLETYIFANDQSGRTIAAALMQRARDGLDVRLLFDAVGSQRTGAEFFAEMAAAGVKVHAYHSVWEALRRFSFFTIFNRRDHRKLLIVDERSAYFGGMNIVDHGRDLRFLNVDEQHAPTTGWRDLHIRLVGPQQAEVAGSFERSWRHAKREHLSRRPKRYRRVKLVDGEDSIHFFDSGPGLKFSRGPRVYRHVLRGARKNIVIAMAYFIPVGRVMGQLLAARRRGVRMSVILPARTDVLVAQYAARHLYKRLLRAGIRLFERDNRVMHTKLLVVDRQWSVVGSSNMDPRSLWINLEFLAVIRSRRFARAACRICGYEMRHSRRITAEYLARRSTWQRIVDFLAYCLRWWL